MSSPDLTAELVVLSGSRRGTVFPLDRAALSVGRNIDVDLRFDPVADLEVSGRHAMFARTANGAWIVKDLGSTNGTYVNGERITGEVALRPSDRIRFGLNGPEVEFRGPAHVSTTGAAWPGTAASPLTGAPTVATRVPVVDAPARNAARNRVVVAAVAAVVVVGAVATILGLRSRNVALQEERALLQQQLDSLRTAGQVSLASLQTEVQELTNALRESQEQVREVSMRLEQAQRAGDPAQIALLRGQLDSATAALARRQAAAALDFRAIQQGNRPAVAMIFVEGPDGRVSTGTAFAVRPDATLVTARHVLTGEDGLQRPRRIAIQFSDSDQVWPARILRIAEDVDLAIVKVDNIIGNVPTIEAFNTRPDTLSAGGVVASIGFPVGRNLTAEATYGRGGIVQPLLSAGIISHVTNDHIEFQGYGSSGASGSPVFDATGAVIAVLFGGLRDSTHPTLLGVPSTAVQRLLASLPE